MQKSLQIYRAFLLLGFSLASLSCTKESYQNQHYLPKQIVTKSQEMEMGDFFVSVEMASQLVLQESKSDPVSIEEYPSDSDPLVYVVNQQQGWKIIPADSRFGLYLAICDSGSIDLRKDLNDGVRVWLQDYMEQIKDARSKDEIPENSRESVAFWERIRNRIEKRNDTGIGITKSLQPDPDQIWAKVEVSYSNNVISNRNQDHLLSTKWGQGSPWNIRLNNAGYNFPMGCVAVACGQILYYFHHNGGIPYDMYHIIDISPVYHYSLYYNYFTFFASRSQYVNFSSYWDQMPLDRSGSNPSCYEYVSNLMLDIGDRVGMKYTENGSFAPGDTLGPYYIDSLFVNSRAFYSDSCQDTVMTNLDNGKPVIINSLIQGEDNGHTWVIDGYKYLQTTESGEYMFVPCLQVDLLNDVIINFYDYSYLLSQYPGLYSGMTVNESTNLLSAMYRMNWGYDGDGDEALYSMTYPSWQGYNGSKSIIYNLEPKGMLIQ